MLYTKEGHELITLINIWHSYVWSSSLYRKINIGWFYWTSCTCNDTRQRTVRLQWVWPENALVQLRSLLVDSFIFTSHCLRRVIRSFITDLLYSPVLAMYRFHCYVTVSRVNVLFFDKYASSPPSSSGFISPSNICCNNTSTFLRPVETHTYLT